jgi:hypothetical protein
MRRSPRIEREMRGLVRAFENETALKAILSVCYLARPGRYWPPSTLKSAAQLVNRWTTIS